MARGGTMTRTLLAAFAMAVRPVPSFVRYRLIATVAREISLWRWRRRHGRRPQAPRPSTRGRRAARAFASSGVVAFLWGPSRGSIFTVREAVRSGKPAAVVLAGGGAALPSFAGGRWASCAFGGVAAFRWVPEVDAPEAYDAEPQRTALHRIFVVPGGEPVHTLLTHISS